MANSCRSDWTRAAIAAGVGIAAAGVIYGVFVRRWHSRWGATDDEVQMPLPGDSIVAKPNMDTTRAITIEATPEDIWPWIVQIGKGRGGLYSYDWLDKAFGYLDQASSEEILPQFQTLKAGDVIPIGCDESTDDDFFVHEVRPLKALVIGANAEAFRERVSWAMVLLPISKSRTRLIMRVRADIELDLKGILLYGLLDPAAFIMLRKQMLNIKCLAESTRRHRLAPATV
jgi:hypothetical protein